MSQTTITVAGMTCGHCASSVTEELSAVPGVSGVSIELNPGQDSPVTYTHDQPVDEALVRAAVEEAGYTVK